MRHGDTSPAIIRGTLSTMATSCQIVTVQNLAPKAIDQPGTNTGSVFVPVIVTVIGKKESRAGPVGFCAPTTRQHRPKGAPPGFRRRPRPVRG